MAREPRTLTQRTKRRWACEAHSVCATDLVAVLVEGVNGGAQDGDERRPGQRQVRLQPPLRLRRTPAGGPCRGQQRVARRKHRTAPRVVACLPLRSMDADGRAWWRCWVLTHPEGLLPCCVGPQPAHGLQQLQPRLNEERSQQLQVAPAGASDAQTLRRCAGGEVQQQARWAWTASPRVRSHARTSRAAGPRRTRWGRRRSTAGRRWRRR